MHQTILQLDSCVSPNGKEEELPMQIHGQLIFGEDASVARGLKFIVKCFPLYEILLAVGNPTIDYFSLDIGSRAEMHVLKTIPWDKVDIKGK